MADRPTPNDRTARPLFFTHIREARAVIRDWLSGSAARERCGMWVGIAGEEFTCQRDLDHAGECLPFRSEVMHLADWHEQQAEGLHNAVMAIGQGGGWPFEGPEEERNGRKRVVYAGGSGGAHRP